jgi:hypothetical protein
MIRRCNIILLGIVLGCFASSASFAQSQSTTYYQPQGQKLKTFLMACGVGAGAGAALGVASLAFVSDPGNNIQNVAKGASLGLYAGILWGYYNVVMTPDAPTYDSTHDSQFLIQPEFHKGQMEGAQAGYIANF